MSTIKITLDNPIVTIPQSDKLSFMLLNNTTYTITLNTVVYSYTTSAIATIVELQDGLIAAITDTNVVVTKDDDSLLISGLYTAMTYDLSENDPNITVTNVSTGVPIYEHVSTSYRVSRIANFDIPEMIIHESLENTTDLISHEFDFNLQTDKTLYAIVKFHFINTSTSQVAASEWSKIIPINGNQTGIKRYGTVIATPVVEIKASVIGDNEIVLELISSAFKLYAGDTQHISTDYVITDTYNNVIWEQRDDTVNLENVKLNSDNIKLGQVYLVKVRYNSVDGASSNYGVGILSTKSAKNKLFDLKLEYPFYVNAYNYFKLYVNVPNFLSVDIAVKDKYGFVVASEFDQATRTPYVRTDGLNTVDNYTIYARIKYTNGEYSEYLEFDTLTCNDNPITLYDPYITYLDDYDYTQELLLGGPVNVMSKEIHTGTILMAKNGDKNIYRYTLNNKILMEDKIVITLDGPNGIIDMPSINITPLKNYRFLLDYDAVRAININSDLVSQATRDYMIANSLETYDDNGLLVINKDGMQEEYITRPKFAIYQYNSITHECTLVDSVFRDDEIKSTALTNALVVNDDKYIYYIPTHMTNTVENNDTYLDLVLRRMDVDTLVIDDIDTLPVSVLANPVLISKDINTLIFMNGSDTLTDIVNGEFIWLRTNDNIYDYNISTGNWTLTGTMDINIDPEMYLLQSVKRRDNKYVLFNNVQLGITIGDQDSIVFDPTDYSFTIDANDMVDDMIYQSTVDLLNGDILRLTTRVQDPQVVYTYVSNTRTLEQLLGDSLINIISDLVVPAGETISVNDIYRYNTITIEGTSDLDTGKLIWVHDDEIIEFQYNDLIVTRDYDLPRNIYNDTTEYKTVTLLEGALLDYYNIIDIPDNTNAVITLPVEFRTLVIGTNSTLQFVEPI